MKTPKYFIQILICLICISTTASGQSCFNIKTLSPSEMFPVTPLPQVREQDVMWHRRLWREIDLNEKINQLLYFPNEKEDRSCSLYDMIFHHLKKGYIKAYDPKDDSFTTELTISELVNMIGDTIYDENKNLIYRELNSRSVVKYWVKEDWFYDTKNAKIDVRISGICPVKIKYDKDGVIQGYQQLFWLYYPHIRGTLVNIEAFKKVEEDDPRVSFDDIFIKRMFNSYIIVKTEGAKQHVTKNKTDLDIKLENEKTRTYNFNSNTSLWGN